MALADRCVGLLTKVARLRIGLTDVGLVMIHHETGCRPQGVDVYTDMGDFSSTEDPGQAMRTACLQHLMSTFCYLALTLWIWAKFLVFYKVWPHDRGFGIRTPGLKRSAADVELAALQVLVDC